jgi:hypothetical protein
MAQCSPSTMFITTKDMRIDWLPCGAEDTHEETLIIRGTGGTFKLWVNGHVTTDITVTATPATVVSSIQTALDALPNLEDDELVVSGTALDEISIDGSSDKFYRILVKDVAITGNTTNDPDIENIVVVQGSKAITFSAALSQFSWRVSITDTDVTPSSDYAMTSLPTGEEVTWDATMRKVTSSAYSYEVEPSVIGLLTVYPEGKYEGKEFFQMWTYINEFSTSGPAREKLEISMSGKRQGDWVWPQGSIYRSGLL